MNLRLSTKTSYLTTSGEIVSKSIEKPNRKEVSVQDKFWGIAANTLRDNSPIRSVMEFGKSKTPSFYYMNEPTEWDLYHTARSTAIGYRLTYGYAGDIWSNEFGFKFPNQNVDTRIMMDFNREARAHLRKIRFFTEFQKSTAFDLEQGAALVLKYRKGDLLEGTEGMRLPEDPTKDIIRCEAVNHIDYTQPDQGPFGISTYYNINFWKKNSSKYSFIVHSSHAQQIRMRNIDYDQYKGQSILKACFSEIQILLNINESISRAAFRWSTGIPVVYTKGIPKGQLSEVKKLIGDPTDQTWLLVQKEFIDDIKPLGLSGTTMNLENYFDIILTQIVCQSEIPKTILLGETASVSRTGAVWEPAYFAKLDKDHHLLEDSILEFLDTDPEFKRILAKYKLVDFELDWGLRQVRTDQEQADLDMRLFSNANAALNFMTLDEIRDYLKLPDLATKIQDHYAKYWFGPAWSVDMLKQVIPNLGQWRQRQLEETMISPEERFQQEMQVTQMQNQMEQAQEAQSGKNPYQAEGKSSVKEIKEPKIGPGGSAEGEAARREKKMERGEPGGKFLQDEDIISSLITTVNDLNTRLKYYELAERLNVSETTFRKVVTGLNQLKEVEEANKKKNLDEKHD